MDSKNLLYSGRWWGGREVTRWGTDNSGFPYCPQIFRFSLYQRSQVFQTESVNWWFPTSVATVPWLLLMILFSHMNCQQIRSLCLLFEAPFELWWWKVYFVVVVVLLKARAAIHGWGRLWWWEDVHKVSDNLLVKTKRILVKDARILHEDI